MEIWKTFMKRSNIRSWGFWNWVCDVPGPIHGTKVYPPRSKQKGWRNALALAWQKVGHGMIPGKGMGRSSHQNGGCGVPLRTAIYDMLIFYITHEPPNIINMMRKLEFTRMKFSTQEHQFSGSTLVRALQLHQGSLKLSQEPKLHHLHPRIINRQLKTVPRPSESESVFFLFSICLQKHQWLIFRKHQCWLTASQNTHADIQKRSVSQSLCTRFAETCRWTMWKRLFYDVLRTRSYKYGSHQTCERPNDETQHNLDVPRESNRAPRDFKAGGAKSSAIGSFQMVLVTASDTASDIIAGSSWLDRYCMFISRWHILMLPRCLDPMVLHETTLRYMKYPQVI